MWYHVRREYLGKNPIIHPRVPDAVLKSVICSSEEGNIPRICVSDHVFKCIEGITGINEPFVEDVARRFDENPCLYITDNTPYVPPNCLDFRDNNEHWFITPTNFVYLGRVNMSKLFRSGVIELTKDKDFIVPKRNKMLMLGNIKSNILKQLVKGEIK